MLKFGRVKRRLRKSSKVKIYKGDILVIIGKTQTDEILEIIQKLQNYGYNATLAFTNKFQKAIKGPNDYLEEEIRSDIKKIFTERKTDSVTILTDNEILKEYVLEFRPGSNIHIIHTTLPSLFRPNETSRNCISQTNLNKVNYKEYPKNIVNVYKLIKNLPKCSIFFTAFGYYRQQYNYKTIIKSFFKFLEKQERLLGNTILLVLGGNYNPKSTIDVEEFKTFHSKITNTEFARNVVLLQNISVEEKKAFLRLSYAMMYFNNSFDINSDVKLAMAVGTPLIGVNDGFVQNVIKKEPLCGYLTPMFETSIVSCMYLLTSPTKYQRASVHSRLNYLKNYSRFSQELKGIKDQTRKKLQLKPVL